MPVSDSIRWGILSTAHIARGSFLPALREAGGVPYAVGGRNLARTEAFARDNGVEHVLEGYAAVVEDERVQAIYNPLPNSLHAEWTIAALRAGKTVLCEKPLCVSLQETEFVLEVARETGSLLWEAFVFPFHAQMARIQQIVGDGTIGDLIEIQASHSFQITDRDNIRLSSSLAGGALNDLGCYFVHLSQLVLGSSPVQAIASAIMAPEGVDEAMQGVIEFAGGRRLVFDCGMNRPPDRFTRLIGSAGEIRLTDPYHPGPDATLELLTPEGREVEHHGERGRTFAPAIRHIQAAMRGEASPRHLAKQDSLATALGLQLVRDSAATGRAVTIEQSAEPTAL